MIGIIHNSYSSHAGTVEKTRLIPAGRQTVDSFFSTFCMNEYEFCMNPLDIKTLRTLRIHCHTIYYEVKQTKKSNNEVKVNHIILLLTISKKCIIVYLAQSSERSLPHLFSSHAHI